MEFNITSAKLTGNPADAGWAQVYEFKPEDSQKLAFRGHLITVIATEIENRDKREIIHALHEKYFSNETVTAFNALRELVESVIEEFWGSGKIEIAAVALMENVVNCAVGGGAQVVVLRAGMLAKILTSAAGENKDSVVTASGYPHDKDVLLLGTNLFFATLSEGVVKAALEQQSPESSVEALAPTVHTGENLSRLGAVVIKFQKIELSPIPASPRKRFADLLALVIRILPERRILVQGTNMQEGKKRKVAVLTGVILLLILSISIFFGIRQRNLQITRSKYELRLISAQHEFDEAQSVFKLNSERARQLLLNARNTVTELEKEGVSDPRLTVLRKDINENIGRILGQYDAQIELFLDLSLVSNGFKVDEMAVSQGKIYLLDKSGQRLIRVSFDTKKTEVLGGSDSVSGSIKIAGYSDYAYVLKDDGIFEIGKEKSGKSSMVIKKDWRDLPDGSQADVWPYMYSGNMYILEKDTNAIWRYTATTGGGFAARANWFGKGVTPNLSNVISWSIDGAIWFLTDSGRIRKFTLGKEDPFTLSGLEADVKGTSLFTSEDLIYLYILDPANSKVVVVTKEGEYKVSYISEEIRNATALAVSEKDKKIILVGGTELTFIELKHLD